MAFIEIMRDNVTRFENMIDAGALENIGRRYFHGLADENDEGEITAAIVWEMEFMRNRERMPEAGIKDIFCRDEDAGVRLLEEYGRQVQDEYGRESHFEFPKEKAESLSKLFSEAGFETWEAESDEIVIPLSELKGLKIMEGGDVPSNIMGLYLLPDEELSRGLKECTEQSGREFMEDAAYLPSDWYEQSLSCFIDTDGEPTGFLLVHLTGAGKLQAELLTARGKDAERDILHMLRFSIREALEQYAPDAEVLVMRRDRKVKKMTDYLLPKIKGAAVIKGRRRE